MTGHYVFFKTHFLTSYSFMDGNCLVRTACSSHFAYCVACCLPVGCVIGRSYCVHWVFDACLLHDSRFVHWKPINLVSLSGCRLATAEHVLCIKGCPNLYTCYFVLLHFTAEARGSIVVEALCYKPEGHRLETR
jgi:hypothetical protein